MNRKVKSLMVLKGITGVDIARKLGISPNTVYVVMGGYGKSRPIHQAIADALGMKVEQLWPENKNRKAA
jgi:lambda repressor-like predicted transcriptional regulator